MIYTVSVLFYLIGSIPTAYIYMKMKHSKNILEEGSGNSGAMNVYDVTQSKRDGIIVLVLDLLKGLIPTAIFLWCTSFQSQELILPAACLILGHNFPVWTKFRGGRGLSTAAGIMLAVNPMLVVIWLITYFIARKIIDNVHVAASIALIVVPVSCWFFGRFLSKFTIPPNFTIWYHGDILFLLTVSVCAVALLKHIVPVYNFIKIKIQS
jgi:glycerol-3-phosphate acyltransferase PlsY